MEPLNYNRLAGKNLGRLEALSDGVFAVAMTLLVLDLKAPLAEAVHSEADLWAALLALSPKLLTYLMSFVTLGIFWLGQQAQFNLLERSNRDVVWVHIAFLMIVCLVPFSTALLSEFMAYRVALLAYWANIFLLGML
ncbi:MAG TPA: TMEM175 family protein, partial [Rhizomicrobium sp.]|nr:TMEM175 family protein [Rhizomicrobium sp.]